MDQVQGAQRASSVYGMSEHWDVLQDEASAAQSVSGLPMIGERFPS